MQLAGLLLLLALQAEHVAADKVTAFYVAVSRAQNSNIYKCNIYKRDVATLLQSEFASHLDSVSGDEAVIVSTFCWTMEHGATNYSKAPKVLFASADVVRAALASAVRRGVPAPLASTDPADLAIILDADVLAALGDDLETITRLCSDPGAVQKWINGHIPLEDVATLAALSFEGRRVACMALSKHLGELKPEVAQMVQRELV
jgi:hypothetical protein